MKLINILLIYFLICSIQSTAQKFHLVKTVSPEKTFNYYTGDAFGNIYILHTDGNIIKYDSINKKSNLPGKKMIGSKIFIDTKNPYKIQIFNSDEQLLSFYNSDFSPSNSISFYKMDIGQIMLCCASSDAGFWVLEENGLNLIHYSSDLIRSSYSMGSVIFDEAAFVPTNMQENREHVLIWQKNASAYILDKFGNQQYYFPYEAQSYHLAIPNLYYFLDQKLHAYNLKLHKDLKIKLPLLKIKKIEICENQFYIWSNDKIYHFVLK